MYIRGVKEEEEGLGNGDVKGIKEESKVNETVKA
jgi:hypothetical protein